MDFSGKVVVFFSGGLSSYLAAKRCVEEYGVDNVVLYFTDVMYEHGTLYSFIDAAARKLGCWFVVECRGKTPFDVFKEVKLMGNTRIDPCSRVLKRELSHVLVEFDCDDDTILCIGYDWTEQSRIDKAIDNWAYNKVIFPMADAPYLTKKQMIEEVMDDGLIIPYLYTIGMAHNNCAGFCVKAGQGHYAVLLREDRDLYIQHEENEQEVYDAIGKTYPFLRVTVDGQLEYMTLRQFRLHLEGNGQCDLFDIGGCGCFSE